MRDLISGLDDGAAWTRSFNVNTSTRGFEGIEMYAFHPQPI